MIRTKALFTLLAMLLSLSGALFAASPPNPPSVTEPLEAGFQNLYKLHFEAAREQFKVYQEANPDDGMGKAAEAASYLFQEFEQKGVLTSAFFLDDKQFLGGIDSPPDHPLCNAFMTSNDEARNLAQKKLKISMEDSQALLVLTMTDGMEADYEEIIAKRQVTSLSLLRKAEQDASKLLAIDPNAADAYVALGAGNYILGSLPSYKRMFLWMGGIHGDRQRGIQEEELAADRGHYFQPYAKILLALASEREHDMNRARELLADLAREFPENPHFAHELLLAEKSPSMVCCQVSR